MNVDQVCSNIRSLDLAQVYHPTVEEQSYFEFYGIDFKSSIEGVSHHFGAIDCGDSHIACHYFSVPDAQRSCFVIHGYMDHVGLFDKMINYLLHRGCNVVAIDLPGHGMSSGRRASIESFGDYVLALRQCLDFFYQKIPSPWHVVAQSMGGAIVMDYLLSQQYDERVGPFDKVLLLAPLVRPKGWFGIRIAHCVLRGFVPSVRRNFAKNSHDNQFLNFMEHQDPLRVERMPIQWVTAMLQWEKRFKQLSWGEMEILVVQGEGDTTVDWRHNLKAIQDKFPRAKFFRIKDARHHLAAESDGYFERVIQAADLYFERRKKPRDTSY